MAKVEANVERQFGNKELEKDFVVQARFANGRLRVEVESPIAGWVGC